MLFIVGRRYLAEIIMGCVSAAAVSSASCRWRTVSTFCFDAASSPCLMASSTFLTIWIRLSRAPIFTSATPAMRTRSFFGSWAMLSLSFASQ